MPKFDSSTMPDCSDSQREMLPPMPDKSCEDNDDGPFREDNVVGTKVLEEEERQRLAKGERQAVECTRILVYLAVAVTGIVVSLMVYSYAKQEQQDEFETQFAAFAAKVAESFYDSVEHKIGAMATFSTTITSYAVTSGARFPNVTIPDYDLMAANTRIQAAGVILYWIPLVTDETRAGWEEYANDNKRAVLSAFKRESKMKFLQDKKFGLAPHQQQPQNAGQVNNASVSTELAPFNIESDYLHSIFSVGRQPRPEGSGPFLPLWQLSPCLPLIKYLNFDFLTHDSISKSLHAALDTQKVVMGGSHDVSTKGDNVSRPIYNAMLQVGQYRHDAVSYEGDPSANLVYPVFDRFGPNRTLAGVVNANLYWRLHFMQILPETAIGVVCVIKNTLGQIFTFQIDGANVTFLGDGDHHDAKYDKLMVSEDVTEKLLARAGPETQSYDAADLNTEFCRYQLFVYPSQPTEDKYVNKEPLYFAMLVAGIFLFVSLVFILYDWSVARRQRIVMAKAVQSAAIVSSLYPKQVRHRLFNDDNHTSSNFSIGSKIEGDEEFGELESGPIADYYQHSTVLFADLAGFTKWSSSRKAEDVFYLLECLYQAFDKIAVSRKVFKVETIGDCYVACTGVPEPQGDHALIMVKFARDCYAKMNSLLPKLTNALGEDTALLSFRVGIHSGPITGGVLRGQKSRFQLFGDTINVASRMESNGVPGCIHISQATADELTEKGCGHWLISRKDKIVAKGKGEMQTYFINFQKPATTETSAAMTTRSSHGDIEV